MKFRSVKQKEYWHDSNQRWNVKTGATRSGKTYMDYYLIPKRLLNVRGKEGLNVILGNTRETLRRNILLPMQNIYGEGRISSIHTDNSCMMFGEKVFVLGADKISHVDRIRGMSIKYCYGDEITTWNKEVFDMLKSRLDKPYSVFDGTCNPASPNHWFKEFLDSDADIYQQQYEIDDNPFLDSTFVSNLKREYAGTVYYDRYILGKWALAEGLVYPRHEDALYEQELETQAEEYCLSLDYGTQNPFACLLWERRGSVWYATHELYYSGRETGIQKTDAEYLEMLEKFAEAIPLQEKIARGIGGYTKRVKRIPVIIDPSASSMIAVLNQSDRFMPLPADNSVLDGIRDTNLAIQRGLIKVHRRCKNWIKEAQSYVWDEKSVEDKVIKDNDHLMDAMRYMVNTKRVLTANYNYQSIFRRQ